LVVVELTQGEVEDENAEDDAGERIPLAERQHPVSRLR